MDNKKQIFIMIITGILTGFVNGLFGGGGGMIVVPLLTGWLLYPTKNAHATAILIILPMSIVSGIIYASYGAFEMNAGLACVIGVTIGGIFGAKLLKILKPNIVAKIFSIVMLVAGIKMLTG